ncbi:hypothetical protein ACFXHA_44595 [Nocardia sp. NPDC059240]|uniref:hypothetical protein n=1 Tax=Nocardia sp. NPDC059240 TaxID=3346786 RepID=UPI003682C673
MRATNLVVALGALAAATALTCGTATADAPLTVDTATASNGDAVVSISYQCAPGLGAELSVTVRETPFLAPGINGPGVNGTALAPAICIGQPQQATVAVNPVQLLQLFGESTKFQSGSTTDVTVSVLQLTPNSPVITARKHFPHLG